jgi:predicted TIM-barrel fold metal-dependent hydrolase
MMSKPKVPIIAIEEHYWDADLAKTFQGAEAGRPGDIHTRLYDFDDLRIKEMDEAGVDIQVLSLGAPGTQKLGPDVAEKMAREVNNRLAERIKKNPSRFAGFAALPSSVPEAAADELERCVKELGFKGAMIHGSANGEYFDNKKFWPIFARAEALDVPIYWHPSLPDPRITDIYLKDYVQDFAMVVRPAWGFTIDTATQAIRLILSGVFEKHPKLKIILGHFGETIPFLLWRIDNALKRPGQKPLEFRQIFTSNFWLTTSGFFSDPALLCCAMEMGVDRILFAVDWPFVLDNKPAVKWMEHVPLSDEDKAKILSGNAKRLLKM